MKKIDLKKELKTFFIPSAKKVTLSKSLSSSSS